MNTMNRNIYLKLIEEIIGLKIWELTNSIDYNLIFSIGRKCHELKNGKVIHHMNDRTKPIIDSEFSFNIFCPWRIEYKNEIITSWREEPEVFLQTLDRIENTIISDIKVSDFYDLTINFSNGLTFTSFCDGCRKDNEDDVDNDYFFSTFTDMFAVCGNRLEYYENSHHKIFIENE